MLKRVLIANRGEIAARIIRECKDNSVGSVAVYSQADANSLHVMLADKAVCIGEPASSKSYLNIGNIIEAARNTDCDAVHPGFGFLSENAEFARVCGEEHIKFIGPSPEVISRLGDKAEAKRTMKAAGVPVVPGSDGPVKDADEAKKVAEKRGATAKNCKTR